MPDSHDPAEFFDPDREPTQPIPPETMRDLIYGVGCAPVGPSRPTRDLRRRQVVTVVPVDPTLDPALDETALDHATLGDTALHMEAL